MNPLLRDLLAPMQYYWVTAQSEYSTDVLFRTRDDLEEVMPRRLTYSTLYFAARDVLAFLGRTHGRLPGRHRHRPGRLQPDAQTPGASHSGGDLGAVPR